MGGAIPGACGRATGGTGAGAATFGAGGCCGVQGGPANAGEARETPCAAAWGILGGIGEVTCWVVPAFGSCCVAGATTGSGVPQKPQNLLPAGNVL